MNGVLPLTAMLGQTRVLYEWLRLQQLTEWWHWAGLVLVCVAIVGYILYWYRRDAVENLRPTGWTLTVCRCAAFIGILLFFLQLEKSSEQRIVRDSRVAVIVDGSMSMSLPGTPFESGIASEISRAAEAEQFFGSNPGWEAIRQKHEVNVYRFDEQARPSLIFSAPKLGNTASSGETIDNTVDSAQSGNLADLRAWLSIALFILVAGVLTWGIALLAQILGYKDWYAGSLLLITGVTLILASLALGGFAIVPATDFSLAEIRTGELGQQSDPETQPQQEQGDTDEVDWASELAPRGSQSRLGDALKSVLQRESSFPLAGIVLLTDGRGNAGLSIRDVLPLAQADRIPLYTVGIGSAAQQNNLELVELDVPKRLYPGDRFRIKALVSGNGFEGKTVSVQVLSGPEDQDDSQLKIEDELNVDLPEDGSVAQVDFQLPPKSIGTWKYAAKVLPVPGELREEDNIKSAEVDVIERKNRILVLAGGPSREYQFVRNLFYRDRDVESHVYLQSGSPQTSQEAQVLLDAFPGSLQELSEYDCIFAFDAD
ncbi:MAG: vWA domain-containing protein, partial [Planctomycetota bacterium]